MGDYGPLLFVWAAHVAFTVWLLRLVHVVQPTPFIDEVFHVPQAQHYCRGHFSTWDSKITTLPGLYVVSVSLLAAVARALALPALPCSLLSLRAISALFSCGLPPLVFAASRTLNSRSVGSWHHALTALSLSIFPLLYTYSFLYYTDVVSTFFVLLLYTLHLHNYRKLSALAGLVAVLVRQTNIVWVVFVGALAACNVLKRATIGPADPHSQPRALHCVTDVWNLATSLDRRQWWRLAGAVWRHTAWHALVAAAFVAFVAHNGAVVVGDRSAHTVHACPEQLVYFLLAAAPFLATHFVCHIGEVCDELVARPLRWLLLCAALAVTLLGRSTPPHPYLLADNRHVTFYLWRRVLAPGPVAPTVALAAAAAVTLLLLSCRLRCCCVLLRLGLAATCCLLLAASWLLELRYFVTPWLMTRLHFGATRQSRRATALELPLFAAINGAAVALFVYKTFSWSDQPGLQRIIW